MKFIFLAGLILFSKCVFSEIVVNLLHEKLAHPGQAIFVYDLVESKSSLVLKVEFKENGSSIDDYLISIGEREIRVPTNVIGCVEMKIEDFAVSITEVPFHRDDWSMSVSFVCAKQDSCHVSYFFDKYDLLEVVKYHGEKKSTLWELPDR